METQVLEGTFAEVQRKFSELPLNPEARLRVIVREQVALPEKSDDSSPSATRRNGQISVPTSELLTTERVNELIYQGDMEDALGENWEEKLAQMQVARLHESDPEKGRVA